jgi:SAM-dependent methyltransferase
VASVHDDWVVRVEGVDARLPEAASRRLQEVMNEARVHARDRELVSFVDARSVRGWYLVTIGLGARHAVIRSRSSGRTLESAVLQCSDSIASRIAYWAAHVPNLTERPPVCETLVRSWMVPTADRTPLLKEEMSRALDEQFVYHLADEEALIRAKLSGEAFYFYGARGLRLSKAWVRLAGRWYRLDDVERPAWQLEMEEGPPVLVSLVPEDGRGPALSISVGREHRTRAATLAEAVSALDQKSPPILSGVLGDWGVHCFIVRPSPDWVCALGYETDVHEIGPDTGPFGVPVWVSTPSRVSRRSRLREVLACPRCHARLDWDAGVCSRCSAAFTTSGDVISFVSAAAGPITHDPGASKNPPAMQLVHDSRFVSDGLVLNVGAGDTAITADNLVNLEISRYPATDVVADAHALPFADGSFDAVFSQSVLEHVRDPFICAREMQRVLKEGGTLHADAPFIAPFHGYPDHYFNPSMNGLRRLFADLEEIDLREGPHHAPSVALFEMLSRFFNLIREDDARRAFLAVSVRELLDLLQSGRHPEITRDLDPRNTFQISAGFSYYGRKCRRKPRDVAN